MKTIRFLWDSEYLDSECTIEYDEETNVDNLPWTYGTNFAIMVTGLVAFIMLVYFPRSGRDKGIIWLPIPLYFLFGGIGFGISGIKHVIVDTKTNPANYPTTVVSYLFLCAGNILLLIVGLAMVGVTCRSDGLWRKILWWIIVLPISGLSVYASFQNIMFGGVVIIATSLFVTVVYCVRVCMDRETRWINLAKAFGVSVYISGMFVQLLLSGRCGGPAYKDCFEECPLPEGFNHNTVFHILICVAYMLWSAAEAIGPSVEVRDGGKCSCISVQAVPEDVLDEAEKGGE